MNDLSDAATMVRGVRALQIRVKSWVNDTWGSSIAKSVRGSACRLLESSIVLARSMGVDLDEVNRIAIRVYGYAIGKPEQEAAWVAISLVACAIAAGIDLGDEIYCELLRIEDPKVRERRRQNDLAQQSRETTAADAPASAPAAPVTATLREKPSRRIEDIARLRGKPESWAIIQYLDELHAANQLLGRPVDRDPSLAAPTPENSGEPPQVPGMNDVDLICYFWFHTRQPEYNCFFSRAQIRRLYWLARTPPPLESDSTILTSAEVDPLIRRIAEASTHNRETRGT